MCVDLVILSASDDGAWCLGHAVCLEGCQSLFVEHGPRGPRGLAAAAAALQGP